MALPRRALGPVAAALLAGLAVLNGALPAPAGASPSAPAASAWKQQKVPAGLKHVVLTGVSCAPRGGRCVTAGYVCARASCGGWEPGRILVTTRPGRRWGVRRSPAPFGSPQAVSCPTASACLITGTKKANGKKTAAILRTVNGGRTWSASPLPTKATLTGLSCPSARTCYAVGTTGGAAASVVIMTRNGGRTWKLRKLPAGVTAVTCASPSSCVALGYGLILTTTDGGTRWLNRHLPRSGDLFSTASCPSARCVAVGTTIDEGAASEATTRNHGATWKLRPGPGFMKDVIAIWCPTPARCTAIGVTLDNAPAIGVSSNGGLSWHYRKDPVRDASLYGVTCDHAGQCVAVGTRNAHRSEPLIIASQ